MKIRGLSYQNKGDLSYQMSIRNYTANFRNYIEGFKPYQY